MEVPWIMRIGPLVTAVVATDTRTVEKCICTPIISRASGTTRDVPPPVLSSVREQGIIPLAESDLFLMRDTYCQNIMLVSSFTLILPSWDCDYGIILVIMIWQ